MRKGLICLSSRWKVANCFKSIVADKGGLGLLPKPTFERCLRHGVSLTFFTGSKELFQELFRPYHSLPFEDLFGPWKHHFIVVIVNECGPEILEDKFKS